MRLELPPTTPLPLRSLALRTLRVKARRSTASLLAATAAALVAGCALPLGPAPAPPVRVKVLAINDFHGNLKPPQGGIRIGSPADTNPAAAVPAGGAEHLATAVAELRAKNPNHIFVAAGDLIGATPLLSAVFRDEPTIESLGLMGLELSAVGNHEFDRGAPELLRIQRGGCEAPGACKGPQPFKGAAFRYLAASTVDTRTGQTLLPAWHVKTFEGIPVAFIGLTLQGTPGIVSPQGVAGLRFDDEADTVNRLVPTLRAQGIEAIVVLIHEGGVPSGGPDECPSISGPIVDIVKRLDKAVDAVVTGHTHRAYNCRIDGRLVTSADKYGTVLTEIDLELDRATRDVTAARAHNVIVGVASFAKDPRQTALIAEYERLAAPLTRRPVGRLAAALSREPDPAGQSPIGNVIADAQAAATRDAGAQFALMNPGGIRASLPVPADGVLRYEDLFAAQPFSNNLVTMSLTGAQLLALLEQQWTAAGARILHASRGLAYSWDSARAPGQRVVPGSVRVAGQPLVPAAAYRVTVNSYLAEGGDGFSVLKAGTERRTGMLDVDALELYVKAQPVLPLPESGSRVSRLN